MSNETIESLWHSHHAKIRRYIRSHVLDHDVTDDLLSSVYMRALVAICNGNGYRQSASGWMWQITRSVIRDYWRYLKVRGWSVELDADLAYDGDDGPLGSSDSLELVSSDPLPHEIVEVAEVADELRCAVAKLPAAQEDLILQRLSGYELPEIAQATGKNYDAVKQVQMRAYINLRKVLAKEAA